MEVVEPYYAKNVIIMHLVSQYRPEPEWPLVIKAFYYLWRVFVFACLTGTLVFTFIDVYINGFVQISDVAMHIINIGKSVLIST